MTGEQETRKPWELDPNERGLRDPTDVTDYLQQTAKCNTCRDLGKSAYFCAKELVLPNLRTHTMLMKTCQGTKAAGGTQPRHGLKPNAA